MMDKNRRVRSLRKALTKAHSTTCFRNWRYYWCIIIFLSITIFLPRIIISSLTIQNNSSETEIKHTTTTTGTNKILVNSFENNGGIHTTSTGTNKLSPTKKSDNPTSIPLIILKNGRSGSTWLKELLSIPGVSKIDREIIKKKSGNEDTQRKKERIMNSLGESRDELAVKGFTACPNLHNGLFQDDFSGLIDDAMAEFPRARIIIFSRTNMFRTAIASHAHFAHKPVCSEGKMMQTSFSFSNFQCELPHIMMYHKRLLALGKDLQERRGYPVHFVMYEDLKRETALTMTKVVDFIFEGCDNTTLCRSPEQDKKIILAKFQPQTGDDNNINSSSSAKKGSRLNIAERSRYVDFFKNLNSTCLMDQLDAIGDPTFDECTFPFKHESSPACEKIDPSYQCVNV